MSDVAPAISLRGVGKQFTKYEDTPAFVNALGNVFTRTKHSKLWAVRGVDLEVAPGECLGVIGRNGAGKSTLLQMLCGVTAPTEGRVQVRGRIAPLISVGVGFHPELTGRENVYVNATILGLTRRQIDQRFDAIVEFSELEDFIDTPVKFYSSGMYVRLGFAVAVQIDPDVLLIDEVLAVGDLAFQMKCYERLNEVRRSGATVVFVTHNLNIVRRLCDRAIVIDHGTKVFEGAADAAVGDFMNRLRTSDQPEVDIGWAKHRNGLARITEVKVLNGAGRKSGSIKSTDELRVRVRIEADAEVRDAYIGVSLHGPDGTLIYRESSYESAWPVMRPGETAEAEVRLSPAVATGSYSVAVRLRQKPQDASGAEIQLDVAPDEIVHVLGRPLLDGLADLGRGISVAAPKPSRARRR